MFVSINYPSKFSERGIQWWRPWWLRENWRTCIQWLHLSEGDKIVRRQGDLKGCVPVLQCNDRCRIWRQKGHNWTEVHSTAAALWEVSKYHLWGLLDHWHFMSMSYWPMWNCLVSRQWGRLHSLAAWNFDSLLLLSHWKTPCSFAAILFYCTPNFIYVKT